MKSFYFGRMAGVAGFARMASAALLSLAGCSFLTVAANEYHLLKKYSFGAAEGSTREYFDYITVDSAARRGAARVPVAWD
jgi:hypothetical protein